MRSRWSVPSFIAISFVIVTGSARPALALGDIVGVEGAMWRQDQSGGASIDNGATGGSRFDFQDTLGLDKSDDVTMGRAWVRLSRFRLVFDYFDSSRSGDATLSQGFTFNGTTYNVGERVLSDMDFKLVQGKFLFTVVDAKVVEVGVGVGFNRAEVRMEMDGSSSGRTTFDQSLPYATLAGSVTVKPFPAFHIRAELDGVSVNQSGTSGDARDARVQVEFYVAHVVGFFAGYRQYRLNIDDDHFGSVENNFKGPYAGIGVKF